MNVLWLFAHPEPRSLGGSLRDRGIKALTGAGHSCRESDLYAMNWKPTVDREDFVPGPGGPETSYDECRPEERLIVGTDARRAYRDGTLSPDIRAEHEKLAWADTLVVQFPLWWYGMPAILKGWFDRVFVKGFAYGVRDPDHPGRTLRYGEGLLADKRALTVMTSGSPGPALGPRGVNGQLDQVLFPLLHGTLWYTGMTVLPPVAVYGADRLSDRQFADAADELCERVLAIPHTPPIAYRTQNGGDYDAELVLRPDHRPGETGIGVHITD
ncbi:NAD(P)H-dependent oxidoreductase [Pseudonocardia eucalypti]|uniref:NAD(P)H-dependent oxidoreductase n=1 Tax=Pseudonocardia eucalypti TaxID=648755 RepID=A0ABP9RGB4_9PSEU|nr:NAD(P)H dehydrogenase (quinone) [Pseudonocardia eucalypti]